MDWPISWQKVKDNAGGYEILDLEDYGITIDGSSDNILVEGTKLLDDMTKVVKSGKTIVIKINLSALTGMNDDLLCPAISYTIDEGGNVDQVIGLTRFALGFTSTPLWAWMNRTSGGNKTEFRIKFANEIPDNHFYNSQIEYVLTFYNGGMSWELGDYLIDLSSAAVTTGTSTNIENEAVEVLNTYSQAGKNLTAKFKFIDPTDSENEVTQVVGLNLMVTNHTTNGATTMAYVGTAAGMFFHVYKENSHWAYSVTQQS